MLKKTRMSADLHKWLPAPRMHKPDATIILKNCSWFKYNLEIWKKLSIS